MTFLYRTNTIAGWRLSLVLLLISTGMLMGASQGRPEFKGRNSLTTHDGHVRLQWVSIAPDAVYEVQQSVTPYFEDPKAIYKGPDLATFVSGLNDGIYYYRFRANDGDWSDTVTLTVKHYSLQLAFTLSGLGAIVFLLTVLVVLKGTTKDTQE